MMTKKLTSFALALVMCLSLCVPALAASSVESKNSENAAVIFRDCGNGLYQPIGNGLLRSVSADSAIQAISTANPDIYCVKSNSYFVRSFENNYVLTERKEVDINTFDPEDYSDIPAEVLESLETEIEKQQQGGNKEFTVAVYAPTSAVNASASATASNYWGGRYKFGMYDLKDYFIELGNAHTDWVTQKGPSAATWAAGLTSIALSGAGINSKTISIFSTGISVLDFALSLAGKKGLTQTSSSDEVEEDTVYNKLGKSTYVYENGDWRFSLQTSKVTITKLNTYSFFTETGDTPFASENHNDTDTSENYNNPQMAIQYLGIGYSDRPIVHTVMGVDYSM